MAAAGLVERDLELESIDLALGGAVAGEGWLQLFEGPAGIGKTALLDQARERADRAAVAVLAARGGELEGGFPYGVVRQLFEPVVRAAGASRRARLLGGAAAIAAPAVMGPEAEPAAPADEFAIVHGLYWLVANLAAESPLALVIDDVHWSDRPSLRFLLYLARRLDGLSATMIVSVRSGEDGSDPGVVDDLGASPGARVNTPSALTDAAVGDLLTVDLGWAPDAAFARACREATGGNPFLVRELAAALIADGIEPATHSSALLEGVGPRSIARATLGRLGRLSLDAVELSRAIAVLGGDARLPRAAALAGLDERQALGALDALVAAGVVPPSQRLEFSHPIVRAAIYDELAPGRRSAAHRRSAELLVAEGAELDAIAAHLLRCEPTGSLDTIAMLRAAATHALALGAPDSAAAYLTRALDEGGQRQLRTTVLFELALAEKLARDPTAIEHLEEVRRIAEDPVTRARAAIEQAETLMFSGEWQQPLALLDGALAELGASDLPLELRARAFRAGITAYDPRLVDEFEQRLPALRELAIGGGDPARLLALLLGAVGAWRGESPGDVVSLVELGWDDGRLLATGADLAVLPQAMGGLIQIDELDRAAELVETVRDSARARGSVIEFMIASSFDAWVQTRRGNLIAAEAELRAGCERALESGVLFALPTLLFGAADVLLERPDAADLATLVETIELGPMAAVSGGAMIVDVRGRLRLAAGERAAAIADLRRAGAIYGALSFLNPTAVAWRSTLALMLGSVERDRKEALELVASELADARRIGRPRGVGVALRVLGMLEGGNVGRAHLEEAVTVLAGSPSRLEHARALVELGAALRRGGERAAARSPLRDGLDLASRCGAIRLAEQARTELAATGAKPRRSYTTTRDALTPSELRVALLAADGRSSQEIAQALFVTTKTIDAHLSHAYSKLGISSRKQLADALKLKREPE